MTTTLLSAPGVRSKQLALAETAMARVMEMVRPGAVDQIAGPQPFDWDFPAMRHGMLSPVEQYLTPTWSMGLRPGPFAAALLEGFGLDPERFEWLVALVDLMETGRNLQADYLMGRQSRSFGPTDRQAFGIMRLTSGTWLYQVGLYPLALRQVDLAPELRVRIYQPVMAESVRAGFGYGAVLSWRQRGVCLPGRAALLQNLCDRDCGLRFRLAFRLPAVAAAAGPQAADRLREIGELAGLAYSLLSEAALLSALQAGPRPDLVEAYRALQPALSAEVAVATAQPFHRDLWDLAIRRAQTGDTAMLIEQAAARPDLPDALASMAHEFCNEAVQLAEGSILPEAVAGLVTGWIRWLDKLAKWPAEWV